MARKTRQQRPADGNTAEPSGEPPRAPTSRKKARSRLPRGTPQPAKPPAAKAVAGRVPSTKSKRKPAEFPIVAIGASAGGLDALKKFLTAMPADSGLALVLIPHLDPTHESLMVELLAKQTQMPVREATDGLAIRPDHVYVIPPNKYLAIKRGALVLSKPPVTRGGQTAIDFALRSLADDQKDAAIGIILSGTGSHGTSGVKEIKLAGGMVMVQEPTTAAYDQMPRSALATGLVDYVLAPESMPEALVTYSERAYRSRKRQARPPAGTADGLRRVLALLQARTRHDFRHYRKHMLIRRIQRRMVLRQIDDFEKYAEHLRQNADEVTALCKDLLIGVTAFFRDPEAFAALAEHVVPKLLERAGDDTPVRVWVPGCATGEEAYSIAILLIEAFRAREKAASLQIFASDIDEHALEIAREGVYADSIVASLSPERLQRFFVKVDEHRYRVSKSLRESVVFARQNLIGDAPFSRLDLICCRNVLIYLEPEIQGKVISLLHFALSEDGYLLLGPSESVGRAVDMFEAVSKKWRLYRRIGPVRRDLVDIPVAAAADERPRRVARADWVPRPALGFTALMQRLIAEDFAPASTLINRRYEILSVQGPLVNYLEFPPGDMTKDLLVMARQGLRAKLRAACHEAIREGRTVSDAEARVRRNGKFVPCVVTVRPITEPKEAEGLLLVVFQDRLLAPSVKQRETGAIEESSMLHEIEDELRATREDLQSTIEELESSNEELKASNEEVMSMNEELQSANEELETSKEELQSLNEELATVNNQLQDKVDDLDNFNNDLTNFMAATDIATVFVDTQLRIKRYTPAAAGLLKLIATDSGRPFRDIAPRLKDDDLLQDLRRVMETLTPIEKEVHADNRWYLRRILPYRAGVDGIGGAVITFVDVTPRMEAEAQALRLATVLVDSSDAVVVCHPDGRIIAWNRAAERMYGYTEAEALKMNMRDLVPDALKDHALELLQRAARYETGEAFETQRRTRDGRLLYAWVTVTLLRDELGNPVAMATAERDVTVRREADEAIRKLNATLEQRIADRTAELAAGEQRVRSILNAAMDAIVTINAAGTIETFNAAAVRLFGHSAAEAIGQNVGILMPSPYREEHDGYLRRYQETREPHLIGAPRELTARRKDGTEFPIHLSVSEVGDLGLFTGIIHDITEQKALQEEILRIATLEQRRIGQDLHDSTQQELTGLGLLAQSLSEALAAQGASQQSELAGKLAAGIAEANRHVRTLARGLVPVAVDAEGLMSALGELASSTEKHHGLSCRFECPVPVDVADEAVATHLYRIAQEAVTNAVKHARTDAISIRLERSDRTLTVEISDEGIGIEQPSIRKEGLGLRIMEHRCALIGGALTVRRRDSGGTVVTCTLPNASRV
jgi:two-component system, chemotaxis family, CheB/CheR fusion protein